MIYLLKPIFWHLIHIGWGELWNRNPNQYGTNRKGQRKRGKRGGMRIRKKKRTLGADVFNLSSIILTEEELKVLDLGLKCIPCAKLNTFDTYIDVNKSVHRLNIKKYFELNKANGNKDKDTTYQHSNLRNASTFNPKNKGNEFLQGNKTMVENDIKKINKYKTVKEHLSS